MKNNSPRQQLPTAKNSPIKSTSKGATDPILPLSSGVPPVGKAEPSVQFQRAGNLAQSTINTLERSKNTLPAARNVSPPTVPTVESEVHADLARVALLELERVGLCQRQVRWAEDGTTLLAIRVVFSPSLWTEDLRLKV